jgi:hypothetical protein
VVVEQHAAMRFAWLRKNSEKNISVEQSRANRLIMTVYNLAWWVPILLPFINIINYRTGFITFTVISFIRLGANLYRNNILAPEQAENYPFRTP